eukprot:CAMPEP_0183561746 /NCGR_PEP_ID=MMETSP0371-20130417/96947_1 /TAXON_ID=268820 /ORGANISM="Peridinium aciculiferum, Strain PAER-2" /LENGTH=279 /DNA_ID=CAMNT_0025770329 /DNA_START=72 /DNA_END=907 /DNA_ORIENTATION=+
MTCDDEDAATAADAPLPALRRLGAMIGDLGAAADPEGAARDAECRIAKLGLFPHEEWSLKHFPEDLHPFCGKGLGIWQYPNQLLPLAVLLHKYRIESYLEIGVAAGGTFTFLCELLAQWHSPSPFRAMACDPAPPGCVSYLQQNPYKEGFKAWLEATPSVEYVQEFSEKLERRWAREGAAPRSFDCVLVDGDHSYEGCWADLQMALRFNAGIIILHDVVGNIECPGVCQAWVEAQDTLKDDFDFFEFAEQYDSVQKNPGERLLGIGVCVQKSMPMRASG